MPAVNPLRIPGAQRSDGPWARVGRDLRLTRRATRIRTLRAMEASTSQNEGFGAFLYAVRGAPVTTEPFHIALVPRSEEGSAVGMQPTASASSPSTLRRDPGNETTSDERAINGIALSVALITPDLETVALDGWPIGYLERVGPVWVALSGPRLDRAVECGQSTERGRALLALIQTAMNRA